MTIEDVVQAVEERAGQKVTSETKLDTLAMDSLDFVDLILHISGQFGDIPDSVVPRINTVNDLYLAAKGEL
jgi:acyl carrier protein